MEGALENIKTLYGVGIIAILALLTSILALAWNIVRDLLIERATLNVVVGFGGLVKIKDEKSGLFVKKGSIPDKETENNKLLFSIVNSGRKPIMIDGIGARCKLLSCIRKKVKAKYFHIVSSRLPKMLQPYEVFNEFEFDNKEIIEHLSDISYFWARDTKGKYWKNSRKNTKELLKTIKK